MQINQLPSNCQDRLANLEARIFKKPKIEILEGFQKGESFDVFPRNQKVSLKQSSLQGTPRKTANDQTLFRQLQITQFTKSLQKKQNYNFYEIEDGGTTDQTLKDKLNQIAIQDVKIKELEKRNTELSAELQEFKDLQSKFESVVKSFVIQIDIQERATLKAYIEESKQKLGEYTYQRDRTHIHEVWADGKDIKLNKEQLKNIESQKEEIDGKKKQFQIQSQTLLLKYVLLQKEEQLLQENLNRLENEKLTYIKTLRRVYDEEHARFKKSNDYQIIGERYLLLNLLGKGGFSEVYKGYDIKEFKYVACKIHQLNPDWSDHSKQNYVKHATREYKVHKELMHPNIVRLYDSVEIDMNTFCTILEFCDGWDLSFQIKKYKCFSEKEAKIIISQILSAMKYTHSQNIIHYDIKPQNILFNQNEIKLTDFGLCKILDDDNSKLELTSQGVGTYWYLPPECFMTGEKPPSISGKVDIWSLGVIFYELLYGVKPFGHGQSQETILKEKIILKSESVNFPSKPLISNECKDFIKGCLNYSQNERFDIVQASNHPYFQKK